MATKRQKPAPLASAHEKVGFLFASIVRCQRLWFRELLAPYGVTPRQYAVLLQLRQRSGQTLKGLSQRLFVDATALSRTLTRMEEAGLIARRQSATDRRASEVVLTAAGRSLVARMQPDLEAARRRLFAGLSAKSLKTLEALLHSVLENLAASSSVDNPLAHSDQEVI